MKRFYHAILACGVFAAVVAAVSCTKDATGGGGGGYNGEPEVNHDMDGILRRNYLWNEEYATLSPDFGLPYDEFLGDVLMRMKTNDLDKKFCIGISRQEFFVFGVLMTSSVCFLSPSMI